jgi:hypothetical protein
MGFLHHCGILQSLKKSRGNQPKPLLKDAIDTRPEKSEGRGPAHHTSSGRLGRNLGVSRGQDPKGTGESRGSMRTVSLATELPIRLDTRFDDSLVG